MSLMSHEMDKKWIKKGFVPSVRFSVGVVWSFAFFDFFDLRTLVKSRGEPTSSVLPQKAFLVGLCVFGSSGVPFLSPGILSLRPFPGFSGERDFLDGTELIEDISDVPISFGSCK